MDAPCPWRAARGPRRHLRTVLESGPAAPGRARRFVGDAVPAAGREAREELVLMVSEIVSNAVVHAAAATRQEGITVEVHQAREWVVVTVTDPGGGFDPALLTGPRPGVPGAHGLEMVAALSDRRGIDSRDPFRIWFARDR